MIQLTDDQQEYVEQVFTRARNLIEHGTWGEIDLGRLESWLGCFENYKASLLAAYLLDNLCYRSKSQFHAMLDVLFTDIRLSSNTLTSPKLIDVISEKNPKEVSIVLTPVLSPDAPPTKSGPYILRLAQRRYDIKNAWMAWPESINYSGALEDVIFVDDFCGTGRQFEKFGKKIALTETYQKHPDVRFWYFVTTIHIKGLTYLNEKFPFLKIRYAELLSENNAALGKTSFDRYQIDGFEGMILEQYDTVISASGLPKNKDFAEGFGELGLAYGFAHATPNNTLPIFWWDTPSWTPLLDR